LIRKIAGSMNNFMKMAPEDMSEKAMKVIENNDELRQQMLSIGLVILTPDGKKYLRGVDVKVPVQRAEKEYELTQENIEKWCYEGWVDLRANSWVAWQERINKIMTQAKEFKGDATGSRFYYTESHWGCFEEFDEGKIVGWVFEHEDNGWRFKR